MALIRIDQTHTSMDRVTLKHDGTDGTRNCFEEDVRIGTGAARAVIDNCMIDQNGTDGTANC